MPKARVSSTSRKHLEIILEDNSNVLAKKSSRHLEPVIGDTVEFEKDGDEYVVNSIEDRKNCLSRSYGKKTKQLGANLDKLYVLTAPGALCNTVFIDRVLASAKFENIPCAIVANKCDLNDDFSKTEETFKVYEKLGYPVHRVSAKKKIGLDSITNSLSDPNKHCLALTGISGVGKSSLINALIPDAEARTSEVSDQTGQGKQTTTQSFAYLYKREGDDLLLIDLPGIQNFGICHLSEEQVRGAFLEFNEVECKFHNCKHVNEPECGVLEGIESGKVVKSRYDSYRNMLEELEDNREY